MNIKIKKVHGYHLEMIFNGQPQLVPCKKDERLVEVVKRGLDLTGNIGRPLEDWQVRDPDGVLLESQRIIQDFNFKSGARLFVSLAVGAGGSIFKHRRQMDRLGEPR